MFQPSGPNFFLSNTIAWKKHSPNTIRRQSIPRAIDTQTHKATICEVSLYNMRPFRAISTFICYVQQFETVGWATEIRTKTQHFGF